MNKDKNEMIAKNLEDMGAEMLVASSLSLEFPSAKVTQSDVAKIFRHCSTLYYELAQLRRDIMVEK